MEEIKQEWEDFKKCTCRTFQDRCSNCMPREEMLAWWLKKLDLAVSKERERIVEGIEKMKIEKYRGFRLEADEKAVNETCRRVINLINTK